MGFVWIFKGKFIKADHQVNVAVILKSLFSNLLLWMKSSDFHWKYNLDDIIKWKHFLRYWPFVRGMHRSPVNSPHKDQCHGALMFSFICAWINGWINKCEAGDLRRHLTHYDFTVMSSQRTKRWQISIGSYNGLVLMRQQGITWTNVYQVI